MSFAAPIVGVVTFGDDRAFEWEHVFATMTVSHHEELLTALRTAPIKLVSAPEVARTREQIDAQIDALRAAGAEALVAHIPCWTAPNLVVRGVQRAALPTALVSNRDPSTHGLVGLLGAGGALDQIGWKHLRIREHVEGGAAIARLLPFARAAAAVGRLRGSVFGLFGGRSLGIDTGTFDPMQWRALFGIDVEHVDQSEILREAAAIPTATTEKALAWLEAEVGAIAYDDAGLTRERLEHQVRCWLATRELALDKGLQFGAVKCMPDLSTHEVPQCLSACFLPGGSGPCGDEDSFMLACEADGDGALTMELLKLVSGGTPAFFADVSYVLEQSGTLCLPNCGAFCSWYAPRREDSTELQAVELRPAKRRGGGAITYFQAAPGPVTLARLGRRAGRYHLLVAPGHIVAPNPDEAALFRQARARHPLPMAFVRLAGDADRLVQAMPANHISGVAGDVTRELVDAADLLDIPVEVIGAELG